MYDPSNAKIQLDSGMVGLIEQELHVDAELFIPGMVSRNFRFWSSPQAVFRRHGAKWICKDYSAKARVEEKTI